MTYLLMVFLAISLIWNGIFLLLRLTQKSPNKIRPQSIELQEFLVDLMSGTAMVAVARVDPANILIRSPKQR